MRGICRTVRVLYATFLSPTETKALIIERRNIIIIDNTVVIYKCGSIAASPRSSHRRAALKKAEKSFLMNQNGRNGMRIDESQEAVAAGPRPMKVKVEITINWLRERLIYLERRADTSRPALSCSCGLASSSTPSISSSHHLRTGVPAGFIIIAKI